MSLRDGVCGNYKSFGIKGLLAVSSFRILGMPRQIAAHPKSIRHPVYLRLRTSDISLFNDVLLHREYEFDMPFTPRTIVDVGANVGLASVYYANTYPDARIIAIEPEVTNFAALIKNVSPYPNILPIHAALWNRDGEVTISDGNGKWNCQVHEGKGCRAITMCTLLSKAGFDTIDLLKVDVEGAEREIFSDCDWMVRVRVMAIELHDRLAPGCREVVERAATGFRQHERGELTFFVNQAALEP